MWGACIGLPAQSLITWTHQTPTYRQHTKSHHFHQPPNLQNFRRTTTPPRRCSASSASSSSRATSRRYVRALPASLRVCLSVFLSVCLYVCGNGLHVIFFITICETRLDSRPSHARFLSPAAGVDRVYGPLLAPHPRLRHPAPRENHGRVLGPIPLVSAFSILFFIFIFVFAFLYVYDPF